MHWPALTPARWKRPSPLRRKGQPHAAATDGAAVRVVRNSSLNLATQGLYSALNLLLVYVLAGLGTERFGRFYLFFSLVLIVQIFWELGATTILTRRIVQSPERLAKNAPGCGGPFHPDCPGLVWERLCASEALGHGGGKTRN